MCLIIPRGASSCPKRVSATALEMPTPGPQIRHRLVGGLICLLLLSTLVHGQNAPTPSPSAPDVIYVNARIWTGDGNYPAAQAMAIRGDRLLAVGSDAAVRALRGPNTRVVDLAGQRVVPGFIDGHWHLPTRRAPI